MNFHKTRFPKTNPNFFLSFGITLCATAESKTKEQKYYDLNVKFQLKCQF